MDPLAQWLLVAAVWLLALDTLGLLYYLYGRTSVPRPEPAAETPEPAAVAPAPPVVRSDARRSRLPERGWSDWNEPKEPEGGEGPDEVGVITPAGDDWLARAKRPGAPWEPR